MKLGRVCLPSALAAFSALILVACSPSVDALKKEFDQGVGGYTGPVRNFPSAYLLRFQQSPDFRIHVATDTKDTKGLNSSISFVGRQRIVAQGADRIGELFMEEGKNSSGQTVRSSNPPLLTVATRTDQLGKFKGVERIDFSGYRSIGVKNIPEPGTEIYDNMLFEMRNFYYLLPERQIRQGDDLMSKEDFLNRILSAYVAKVGKISHSSILENTLSSRIIGLTTMNGTDHLVISQSGSATLFVDGATARLMMRGYILMNPVFPNMFSSKMHATVSVISDDGSYTNEIIQRIDVAP